MLRVWKLSSALNRSALASGTALVEGGHRQVPTDQEGPSQGILDVFRSCPMVRLIFLGYLGYTHGSGGKTCSSGSAEPCINPAQDALGYGDRVCDGGFESFKPL